MQGEDYEEHDFANKMKRNANADEISNFIVNLSEKQNEPFRKV